MARFLFYVIFIHYNGSYYILMAHNYIFVVFYLIYITAILESWYIMIYLKDSDIEFDMAVT